MYYQQLENKIHKNTPFLAVPRNISYIGLNLMKYVQDLCIRNYKILLREIRLKRIYLFPVYELEDSIYYDSNSPQMDL